MTAMDPSRLNMWGSRPLPEEAAALSLMREGPGDVRPAMLLLFHAQDVSQVRAVHLYGVGYLMGWCRVHDLAVSREAIEYAVGDALALMWCRRAPETASDRARSLGMRYARYLDLRAIALELLQTRLHEARVRFASGTIYTREPPYSESGSSPPRDSSRSAPGPAQHSSSPVPP